MSRRKKVGGGDVGRIGKKGENERKEEKKRKKDRGGEEEKVCVSVYVSAFAYSCTVHFHNAHTLLHANIDRCP